MNLDDLPAHILHRANAGLPMTAARTSVLLEWQALALGAARAEEAVQAVLDAIAVQFGSHRVSLVRRDASRPGRPASVLALSHGADVDARREAVQVLAQAADEALDAGAAVEWPAPAPAHTPAHAPAAHSATAAPPALAHAALHKAGESAWVMGVPFDLDGPWPAVLIFEQPAPLAHDQRLLALDTALFIAPVLLLKLRLEPPFAARLRGLFTGPATRDGEGWLSASRLAMLAAAVGVVAAALWPTTHHIVAQARIEGLGQRSISAPSDGFLQTVAARPGERIKAGQVLATLDDREPQLELERSTAERAQVERQYSDALARDDAGAIVAGRARLEQLTAQHQLAQQRVQRSRLLAPFDGVLIGGDLAASVGMPVQRGQELMVVAPATGWRLIAEVDEQDITGVQIGQTTQVLFAALAGRTADFRIVRVSPVSVQREGRNVFEAEGQLLEPVDGLQPGLRGVARIEAGERSPASAWWERGSHALRRLWWTFVA